MALSWFDATKAEAFGQNLAKFIIERIPATPEAKRGKSVEKQLEVADKLNLKIDQFKQNCKLNIYKKAKLGSAFKFEMQAAGYKPEFIDQITKSIMLRL